MGECKPRIPAWARACCVAGNVRHACSTWTQQQWQGHMHMMMRPLSGTWGMGAGDTQPMRALLLRTCAPPPPPRPTHPPPHAHTPPSPITRCTYLRDGAQEHGGQPAVVVGRSAALQRRARGRVQLRPLLQLHQRRQDDHPAPTEPGPRPGRQATPCSDAMKCTHRAGQNSESPPTPPLPHHHHPRAHTQPCPSACVPDGIPPPRLQVAAGR